MNQSFHLYQLQKVDTQLDQARQRLKEIDRLLGDNETVRAASDRMANCEESLNKARKMLRHLEETRQARAIKKEQSEASLYGGKVKNPKELQDLQSEVAALQRAISNLEDETLEAMLQVEAAEKENQFASNELNNAKAKAAEQHSGLLGEQSLLQKNLQRLEREKTMLLAQIQPEMLTLYERLRSTKRGIAVSPVTDGACQSCGSELTPAESQIARSPSKIFNCPSCGRILYAG